MGVRFRGWQHMSKSTKTVIPAKAGIPETNGLAPRLRFPEFRNAGEWEIKSLGDVCSVLQGYGFPTDMQGRLDGEYPFCKVSDVSKAVAENGGLLDDAANYVGKQELSKLRAKLIPVGSTVFAKIGEALRLNRRAYVSRECLIDNNVVGLKAADGSADDYFIYISSQLIDLNEHCGGAVPSVNKTTLEAVEVVVPSLDEQQIIADCLSSLDALIAAQADKIDALKIHKKGLMQQLFPREGETVPRLRFPEFRDAGEWKWRPLGEIAEIKLGKMLDKKKHRSGQLLPYLNNLAVRWNDFDTSDLPKMYFDTDELERYELAKGDVIVCEGGEPGRSAVWDGRLSNMKFQKALHRVRFQIQFVPHLLVHYLETIAATEAFESLFTGGGIKHLTRQTFTILPIPVASPAEQDCTANCLSSLDALISAHKEKLDVLKTHKKGLMQQLFPSTEAVEA